MGDKQANTPILGRKDLPLIILSGVDSFRGLDGVSVGSFGTVQDVLVVREPVPISLAILFRERDLEEEMTHLLRR